MWYTLAYLVLTAPNEPEIPPALAAAEPFRSAVQALAVEWEILDPREKRWVMTQAEDVATDLRMLRRRYTELADAPLAIDVLRFPDKETLSSCLSFNRAYRRNLEGQWTPGHEYEQSQALAEVDHLYTIWDYARDARVDFFSITVRRTALKGLREAIGPEAYARGELPCHVPLHRFHEVD